MSDITNTFIHIENGAHTGAFGKNSLPEPTENQCRAGNYKMGRIFLYGLPIAIEQPRGTYRTGIDTKTGKRWVSRMAAHYGYFSNTKGKDGDGVDVFVGFYPQSEQAYVANQFIDGGFDEHKVLLAYPDEQSAKRAYLDSYERGWNGLESITPLSISQLKWWLKNGDMSRPLRLQNIPPEGLENMNRVYWNNDALPYDHTLDGLLYDIRRSENGDLLMDAVSIQDFIEDSDGILALDGLVTPYARLERKMEILRGIMERVSTAVKPVALQITEPFKQRGVANVAAVFELSDGQTVSVFLHNPDVTPNKMAPMDEVISWKWLLNKKDITIVVAPERGEDLNPREVARRIIKLAEKNSAAFTRANAKRSERMQNIENLKTEIVGLEKELADAHHELEVAKVEAENRKPISQPDPNPPEPQPDNIAETTNPAKQEKDDSNIHVPFTMATNGKVIAYDRDGNALPDDWTGVVISSEGSGSTPTYFYLGQDNGERSFHGLQAETYEEALKESEKYQNSLEINHDDQTKSGDVANTTAASGDIFTVASKSFESYLEESKGDTFEAAKAFFKSEMQGKIIRTVIGDVHMLGSSWREMKRGMKSDELKAKLVSLVPEILSTGTYNGRTELNKNRSDQFVAFHFFEKEMVFDGGILVTAGVNVGERPNGEFVYTVYGIGHDGISNWIKKKAAPENSLDAALIRGELFRGPGVPSEPTAKPGSTSSPLLTMDSILDEANSNVNVESDVINIVILKVIDQTSGKRVSDLEDGLIQEPGSKVDRITDPDSDLATVLQDIVDGKYDDTDLNRLLDMIDEAANAIINAGLGDQYDALIGAAAEHWASLDLKVNG